MVLLLDWRKHMDLSLDNLAESFNAFFDGEARVLILKGDWGVGKTYFWNEYINLRIQQGCLPQLAYSYVSLFGANSLEDVRKSIFHNAKPLKTKEEVDSAFEFQEAESTWFYERMPHIKTALLDRLARKASILGKFTKHTQDLPVVGKFVNFASRFEYGYINNYLVCFDDLERKGKNLTVREIMGLADELAQRKRCKVVIVFNEESLGESKDDYAEFQSYREKVVDMEVVHSPSSKRNFSCVFDEGFVGRQSLETAIVSMGVKNIRVLRKLKWLVERFNVYISHAHSSIANEFYLHAALLCCEFFIRNKKLGYEELLSRLPTTSWMSTKQPDTGNATADKRFGELVSNLKLSSSAFDIHIDSFLQHGFLDSQLLIQTIGEMEEGIRFNTANYKLHNAWEIYSNSFENNFNEFSGGLKDVLDNDLDKISLSDFSSAIDVLADFGEPVTDYIERFVGLNEDKLDSKNKSHDWSVRRAINVELSTAIKALKHESMVMDLDQVTLRIAEDNGWANNDIEFLYSLEVEDYIDWMKSSPADLQTKIVNGLYQFNDLSSSKNELTVKFENISEKVRQALIRIASESKLNALRVKNIYKVEV